MTVDMEHMTARQVLRLLYEHTNDGEFATLDGLLVKADLMWVCGGDCRFLNPTSDPFCHGCAKRRGGDGA